MERRRWRAGRTGVGARGAGHGRHNRAWAHSTRRGRHRRREQLGGAYGRRRVQRYARRPGTASTCRKMALKTGKNKFFCNYSSKFDRPAHPYGHQILVAPPMEGCNRVLGSHLRRNRDQRKDKNHHIVGINWDYQRE